MSDNFIIDNMTWSFSRMNGFYGNCQLEWKRHYIDCEDSCDSFDSQVGGFVHKILERYFKGELSEFELAPYFEEHYKDEVTFPCPYLNGDTKYPKIKDYLENFSFDHNKYDILGVEKEVNFKIKDKYDCIGFIDLLLKDKETGEIILCDHKSSSIKILKNGKVSKSDLEHFEAFKRQQLLYSYVVLQEYGRVDKLKWNMFKDSTEIEIEWTQKDLNDALDWAYQTIQKIEQETDYNPLPNYYYCNNLCSVRDKMDCPYRRLGVIYDGIYSKCYNSKNKEFADYGGVGIGFCEDWKNDKQAFFEWALESGYTDSTILKRYDETDNFDFFNCYWEERSMSEEYYGE